MAIFKQLRTRRIECEMTQAELAEAAGIDDKHLAKIERGNKQPFTHTFFKLAIALDLDTNRVLKNIQQEYDSTTND